MKTKTTTLAPELEIEPGRRAERDTAGEKDARV
jgi:hypothetical protein